MKKLRTFMTLCLVALSTSLAIANNEEERPYGSSIEASLPGSVILKMRNADNGETSISSFDGYYTYIYINSANNFTWKYNSGLLVEFASIGKVEGLGQISKVPSSGWAQEVSIFVGHGYVVRWAHVSRDIFGKIENYESGYKYKRIYVHDEILSTSGGVIGYIVSYIDGM